MKDFPAVPHVADAPPELLESGHLWLLERIAGGPLRFRLQESGLLRFADGERLYDDPKALPAEYQQTVRHVRGRLDRDALRRAVEDVESIVFFGVATYHDGVAYDWERTPPFLGVDVWAGDEGAFRPPDAARGIFERLGLEPVNAVAREIRARDFDPDSYAIPDSAWYDGPAAGVVVRNKRGERAEIPHPSVGEREEDGSDQGAVDPLVDSPVDVAEEYATRERFERLAGDLEAAGEPVTFDALFERLLETVHREARARFDHDETNLDEEAFRSEVAARTQTFLDEWSDRST